MDVYLTEEIFSRILGSIAVELKRYYDKSYPVLIGVGISGAEVVGRLPEILGDEEIEVYGCDVVRKGAKVSNVTDFPKGAVKGKKVLITYVRVDTGYTLRAITKLALASGATDVKTMSIAARNSASCFPHFFSSIINAEDNLYLLIDGYPPNVDWAYPQVLIPPSDFVRELNDEDACSKWFKCGDDRIDKNCVGDYLYFLKKSKKGKVFVVEKDDKIVGVLHFSINSLTVARIDTFAIDKDCQGQNIGTDLLLFFIEYSKFNGIRSIVLDAFKETESFYQEKAGFKSTGKFKIANYGDFVVMRRRLS